MALLVCGLTAAPCPYLYEHRQSCPGVTQAGLFGSHFAWPFMSDAKSFEKKRLQVRELMVMTPSHERGVASSAESSAEWQTPKGKTR